MAADWIVAPEEFAAPASLDPVLIEGPPDRAVGRWPAASAGRATDPWPAASAGAWRSPRRSWRDRLGGAFEALIPASLHGARLDPGRRGVAAIAVIAVLAATLAGVAAWRARPEPVIVSAPVPDEVSASPGGGPVVVVAVTGKVRRPGLVRLPAGSRVADALAAAGGVLPGVDAGPINLARKLVDGELVVVGTPTGAAPPGSASPRAPGGSLLDLNTATAEQLDGLPGVGQVLAQRIVEYRTAHGGFRAVDQLREVDGIGESRFQKLRTLVTV
jgi:competence protein ComEA